MIDVSRPTDLGRNPARLADDMDQRAPSLPLDAHG